MTYQLTVGLEVHVELKTKTKMFCGCKNDPFNSEPNVNVCPVCYGLPGALPLLNKEAVRLTVELGQALHGQIAPKTFWARKNYFYPDLPKGYQISQSTAPIVEKATLEIDGVKHNIQRIHLEEDAGKSVHQAGRANSFVNFNRAGVPLMEMVTEPDFHSSADAKRFCQEIQRIVRALEISDADMEKGQMRCEANISVSQKSIRQLADKSQKLGTKVEVKNINSFRAVEKAISYEFERQVELLNKEQSVIAETRTWDSISNKTIPMRTKETSADYRYFPEPDLPMVSIDVIATEKRQLPDEQRKQLQDLGLSPHIAEVIVDKHFFESLIVIAGRDDSLLKDVANSFVAFPRFSELKVDDQIEVVKARKSQGWTAATFEEAIESLLKGIPMELGGGSEFDVESVVEEVLALNKGPVADYLAGKENALHFLVGQVMAKTKGKANITEVRVELQKHLKKS